MTGQLLRGFAAGLLATTALVGSPAMAQDSIEARLDRLEQMVAGMQARMDAGSATPEDAAVVGEMRQAIVDTRKVAQRQDALEEKVAASEKSSSNGFMVGATNVTIGGYVKLDVSTLRTSGGQLDSNAVTRDFLLPGTIPIGGTPSGWDTDYSARQSRILLKTSTPVGDHKIGTAFELDFMVTDGGDERVSNSFVPRMRQAYITFDDFLFGQAWSTFQNVSALPDSLDFVGTMPGTVFVRQPMVRYSKNGFSVAAEQPETTVTNSVGGRVVAGDDSLPDFVLRYEKSGVSLAGIVRTLKVTNNDFGLGSDSAIGYGASIAGNIPLGTQNDIRFMGTVGKGLGRYMGANIVNDAAIDASGALKPITTYSGFAAFRHHWSPMLRSTVAGSYFKADNPVLLTGFGPTDSVWNSFVNLIYSPVPKLDFGIEYSFAERENEAGASGSLQKVQASAKYSF